VFRSLKELMGYKLWAKDGHNFHRSDSGCGPLQPPFDPNLAVNRQYEEVLYDYHGRPKYWQVIEK